MTAAGSTLIFRSVFRGEAVLPAIWYLGLTNASYTFDGVTLAELAAGEPVGNGYARQVLNQDTSDWTISEVNGVIQVQSKTVIFTASANWDKSYSRMFLCDASAGTAGIVYAVSGPTPAPRTVLLGAGPSVSYQFFLRG